MSKNLKNAVRKAIQVRQTRKQPQTQSPAIPQIPGLTGEQIAALLAALGQQQAPAQPTKKKEKAAELPPSWIVRRAAWAERETYEIADTNKDGGEFNRALWSGSKAKLRQLIDAISELQEEIAAIVD